MNKILYILTFIWLSAFSLEAQIDQVSVGSSYSQQAYYSLSTGTVEVVDNDAWDISFSALGLQDAGIFINESASFMGAPLQVFLAPTNDWREEVTNSETFVDSVALHNPETSWSDGAFNSMKDPNSPFDFGWGAYNPQTNIVEGTIVFVIKKRDESLLKMQVGSLSDGVYTIKWAALDGSNEKTYEVAKSDAEDGMVYFSFETEATVDMPSDYDLIFQRYTTPLDAGDGNNIQYTVTGVLLSNGTEAAVVDGVDPISVSEADYTDKYSALPTTIGYSWKSFSFSSGWLIDEDRTHFVKTSEGEIYQVTFYDFEGSSTGITTLERKLLGTVSTEEKIADQFDFVVYPNPTTDHVILIHDEDLEVNISILDNLGRLHKSLILKTNEAISVVELPTGTYYFKIRSAKGALTKKLIVR